MSIENRFFFFSLHREAKNKNGKKNFFFQIIFGKQESAKESSFLQGCPN
jgi:hypothetical protein